VEYWSKRWQDENAKYQITADKVTELEREVERLTHSEQECKREIADLRKQIGEKSY
jgi:cell division protein FtsB